MKPLIVAGLLSLAGTAYAGNADAFTEGFAKGLQQAIAARQGYQAQQYQQQYDYQQAQQQAQFEEQLRLLREQIEIQRRMLQQQQNQEIRDVTNQ